MQVGLVLTLEGIDGRNVPSYREVRAWAQQAEAAGFDALWLYDHLLFRSEHGAHGQWECFTILPAIAEATERIGLGTLVACAGFRNPALLAKMTTTLDEVSGGRFVLGLGAGWNETEFHAYGLPFDHRVARFEEALQIVRSLLRDGNVDFRGRYHAAPECELAPRGSSPHGPPLMIGASGPRMLRLAACYADWINTGFDPADPAASRTPIEAACADVDRDPATLVVTTTPWAAFPDLGPIPAHMRDSIYRSPDALAERLAAYQCAGVHGVMIDCKPANAAALERVSEALRLFRA